MKKCTIVTAILLLSVFRVAAATYYVATNGDDANSGTIDAPFATLSKAQSLVAAGDTVYIRGGTYTITEAQVMDNTSSTTWAYVFKMDKSGSASKKICYFGYPGERPVFDLSNVKPAGKRVIVFYVTKSYLYFRNFEVTGTQVTITGHTQSECFRNDGGNNNIYENLAMHDGMAIGFYLTKGFNNLVLNCDAYNNYDPVSEGGSGENVDGFGAHPNSVGSTNNVFRGCRAWYNSDDGFDFIGALTACTIENCWSFYNGYKPPDYGNLVPAGNGTGFKAGGYGMSTLSSAELALDPIPMHVVTNSLAYYNKNRGFYSNHHLGGITFQGNTACRNPYNYDMTNRESKEGTPTDVPGYGHVIRNNVSYLPRTSGGDIYNVNAEASTIENNSFLPVPIAVSDADFISVDATELTLPRKADGSLPDINFLRAKNTSALFADNMGYLFDAQPLPEGFDAITAVVKNDSIYISWTTLSETNTSYFDVEASKDSVTFVKIGSLSSKAPDGTSRVPTQYSFVKQIGATMALLGISVLGWLLGFSIKTGKDNSYRRLLLVAISIAAMAFYACHKSWPVYSGHGDLYIRIKQVDKDGLFKYSDAVKVVRSYE